MKNLLFIFLILLIPTACFSQFNFTVNASVPPEFEGQNVTLVVMDDIGRYIEESYTSNVKGGKTLLAGSMASPVKNVVLETKSGSGKKYSLKFALDTGKNILSILVLNDAYGTLKLQGSLSPSNALKKAIDSLRASTYSEYRVRQKLGNGAVQLPAQESQQLDLDMLKLLKNNSFSYYALMQLYLMSKSITMDRSPEILISVLNSFDKRLQDSELGLKISESQSRHIASSKASRVGQKMFEFEIKNVPDGKKLTSKELENKPYVIAFSATWCVPCHEKLPILKGMYEKYKEKGLEVIYYNQDDNFDEWVRDIKKNKLTWLSVSEVKGPNSLGSRLGVTYIPTYFIIDKSGTIIYNSDQMDVDLENLESYIKRSL